VPLPLAAGPSTAMMRLRGRFFNALCLAKARALTGPNRYGKARPRTLPQAGTPTEFKLETYEMVKPEWGTKRTCPKCSTRFYDLTNDNPIHCIECGTEWVPEPVLKSKQPMAFEPAPVAAKEPTEDAELAAEELAVDEDAEVSADEEVDLNTGDDDLGVETAGDDDES
jgi:uncharacterized protein (TIGR02300 family)